MNTAHDVKWSYRQTEDPDVVVLYSEKEGKIEFVDKLSLSGYSNIKNLDTQMPNAPFRAYFDFTYRCNLQCRHCITNSSPFINTSKELTTETILSTITDLAKAGVFEIQTGGGESFTHQDWYRIFKHIRACGMNLLITTNGHLIDAQTVMKLIEIDPLETRVSFDGGQKKHDMIRGDGAYDKGVAAINRLVSAGLRTVVRLTLCGGFDEDLDKLFRDISNAGISALKVAVIKESGRAGNEENQYLLHTYDEQEDVALISGLAEKYGLNVQFSADDFPLSITESNDPKLRALKRNNCGAGFETVYISPVGDVLGCVTLPDFPFGNVAENSFAEIWNGTAATRYQHQFRNPHEWKICDDCARCKMANNNQAVG